MAGVIRTALLIRLAGSCHARYVLILLLGVSASAAQTTGSAVAQATAQLPVDLTGLWVAKERYGRDIQGTLLILPRQGGLVADLAGFSVPVTQQGTKISFAVPGSKGSFRGTRTGEEIVGQWIQTPTVSSGAAYATPIVLSPGRLRSLAR